jgi:hypothetical protein
VPPIDSDVHARRDRANVGIPQLQPNIGEARTLARARDQLQAEVDVPHQARSFTDCDSRIIAAKDAWAG